MSNVFKMASGKLGKKIAAFKEMQAVGLNIVTTSLLKLKNNDAVKKYKLFGKNLSYINSYDLIHSLEEIFVQKVYKTAMQQKPVIIDCGANIGLSILYFKRAYPAAKIIGFEPDNNNYELLIKNINEYALTDVEVHKNAVWDKEEMLLFKSITSLGSKIVVGDTEGTYEVKAVSLKTYLQTPVDFLKIDIEGAEYNVIKDIKDELVNVKNVFIEYHSSFEEQGKLLEVLKIIKNAGLKFYIKEAHPVFKTPFMREPTAHPFEIQLNIFCFRN